MHLIDKTELNTNYLSVQLVVGMNQHLPWQRNCGCCVLSRLGDVPASREVNLQQKIDQVENVDLRQPKQIYGKPADLMKKITHEHRERGRPCKSIFLCPR